MLEFILAVSFAVIISASCSVTEAVLYSVPWSHIEQLRKKGKRSGELLFSLRSNIDKPITAVLTLNTVANTAGASIAGAAAAKVFGAEYMATFAACFTVVILVFSEIIPKTLGVTYCRPLASAVAAPLNFLVWALSPIIIVGGWITKLLTPRKTRPEASEEDIRALVSLSRKSGVLKPYEEISIQNILSLDKKRVEEIMTPRTVVFSLQADMTVEAAHEQPGFWNYSRIPVWQDDNEDMVGIVMRRHVLQEVAADRHMTRLCEIMTPVTFVLESLTLDRLLTQMLERRVHLAVVLDEYGGVAGVVSLEDVLEEILGKEIVDESDQFVDLQQLARTRRANLTNSKES
ncbi:hemolysin family protein [Oleidesulfovibrio sp.]|uniref:hemolysin family protein n=1 Tax=Oleidesulfovibrio sp. TaxID=2909707 RepID=UPI003A841E2A